MAKNLFDRAAALDAAFVSRVSSGDMPSIITGDMPAVRLADIFDTQLMNRHLDLMARRLRQAAKILFLAGVIKFWAG